MNANLLRRVNWLWKHRHTHDGDTIQEQITIINQEIERHAGGIAAGGSGARIHLTLDAAQTIAVAGELVEWTWEDHRFTRLEFAQPVFPATAVEVLKDGYYGVLLKHFEWDTWDGGGTVQVIRTRDEVDVVMEEWTATSGQTGGGLAAPIPCEPGDTISVFIDHDDSSAQDLARAEMSIYLIDRERDFEWEMVFALTDRWGVTFDTARGTWFITDYANNANPALFEVDVDGTVLNSYAGWDDGNSGADPTTNASLVYAEAFLWGVGQSDDPVVSKVDPSDGSVDASFSPNTGGVHGWLGIGYDGNLLAVDAATANRYVEEYTTAGAFQQQIAMPSGHTLAGVTWDGVHWWATTTGGAVLKLDSSFVVTDEIAGPPSGGSYTATLGGGPYGDCHFRAGFLYVMTRQGLWRKAV